MAHFYAHALSILLASGLLLPNVEAQQGGTVAMHADQANVTLAPKTADATTLKQNPLKMLRELEPPIQEPYVLGSGDTIGLYVASHSELSKEYIVGPDGFITIDLAGSVKIAGFTRDEAARAAEHALSFYYTHPVVTVSVEKYGSNTIMIFGNVQHPGILVYDGTVPTLLDAIGRGGLLVNPDAKDGLPTRCIIYRGDDTVVPVELRQLLMSNSPLSDIRLRRGDKVFVPVDQRRFVSVLGQVEKPGPVELTPDLDLKMLLSQAGGIKDEAGGNPNLHIIQASNNNETIIPFRDLMTPTGGREVALSPGDIVFVPKSGFSKVTYVLTKISPVATMVTLGALLAP
jgi:polysaccharide export outer membrane protein